MKRPRKTMLLKIIISLIGAGLIAGAINFTTKNIDAEISFIWTLFYATIIYGVLSFVFRNEGKVE